MNKKILVLLISFGSLLLSSCGGSIEASTSTSNISTQSSVVSTSSTTQIITSSTTSITTSITSSSSSTTHITSSTTTAPKPTDYYASINDSMSGDELLRALKEIIKVNRNFSKSVDYSWTRFEEADECETDESCVYLIYTRKSMKKTSRNNGGSTGWNREHTFPKSKISVPNANFDNHLIFASDCQVNGKRGNLIFDDLTSKPKGVNIKDQNGDETTCRMLKNESFDPGDCQSRGEVARATLYAATLYGFDITDNFSSLGLCLNWHENYPPTNRETKRNDIVFKNQGNRNPFIDHPEYASRIWSIN